MGLITGIMQFLFGDGRNIVADTVEVFRENSEKGAVRAADARADSLEQFAAEFLHPARGMFDRLVDALNRLPRPFLALGTIWMFVMAMYDPEKFSQGMQGLMLVPEPLWWLMGAIVSFYFGARHQAKGLEMQRSMMQSMALMQQFKPQEPTEIAAPQSNAALADWHASRG